VNWALLANSLLVSASATALAALFGLTVAICACCAGRRFSAVLLACGAMALALPPFLVTNCWLHFLGQTGVWRSWLPMNILSLPGATWILAMLLWPISFFLAWGAWQQLESSQLEIDPMVRGFTLIKGVLLPLARSSVAQAAVLTFVLAFSNFAVPSILQVKVLPAVIWVQFSVAFDTAAALKLSWPLIVIPLLLLAFLRFRAFNLPPVERRASGKVFRIQLGRPIALMCTMATGLVCLSAVGLPLIQLASTARTWTELPGALAANRSALWNSLLLSSLSAAVIMLIALLANPSRARSAPVRFAAINLFNLFNLLNFAWLFFLIPGVLLGIVLIKIFNRPVLAAFYQSMGIVVLAFVIRYFGPGLTATRHACSSLDRDLTDAARLSGASRWQMVRYIYWPQIGSRVAAAWFIVFLLCLWDVESMILIVPPGSETVALRIFNFLHYGHNAQVNALCVALLALALLPLVLYKVVSRFTFHVSRVASLVLTLAFLAGCSASSPNTSSLSSRIFSAVQIIGTRGVGVGQLNKPRSVAIDSQDNLFVVDMTGRVQKFSSNGVFMLSWQMPQTDLGKPKGMCRDREGNILVVEPHYQRVNHFSPEGKLVAQWGVRGTNEGQFILPRAVAVNSHNDIFVSEYEGRERVQKFKLGTAANGKPQASFISGIGHAGTGPCEFNRPEGICVDSQDRLYVADSCNHRIQIFSADGGLIASYGKAGTGLGELSYPYDICVDKAGRQYVCEFGNSRIQVFDAQNHPIEIIGGPGAEPGRFSNPWGVALDSAGNLYVADSQNHRVQKLIRKESVASGQWSVAETHGMAADWTPSADYGLLITN
jgi:ABC-type Fe3+ transport system permease subunit/DNA-binding beta-propeller fold protein YncE